MNVLILGGGGREHALAWRLSISPLLSRLYASPGNAGIEACAHCVHIDAADQDAVISFCRDKAIDLVVIGPEVALVAGLADALQAAGVQAFGPGRLAARLEGSKAFTKQICAQYNIPTAAYACFADATRAKAHACNQRVPLVVKADGLAAGKGVVIAVNHEEAYQAIDYCFSGGFGGAGKKIVIEEFLEGEEVSFFALSDGHHVLPLTSAQDHKRVGDGDKGPNTGGMGAYSPAPLMDEAMTQRVMDEIIKPTLRAMRDRGHPYQGVLFAGLMITKDGPKLIEHNCRFGDPECQVLMMRLESDLLALINATVEGRLNECDVKWSNQAALTIVMASKGYPAAYEKNTPIYNVRDDTPAYTKVFHAGTAYQNGRLIAIGGRVLCITACGDTITEAQRRAYGLIQKIEWKNGFYRNDIGWRAAEREAQIKSG